MVPIKILKKSTTHTFILLQNMQIFFFWEGGGNLVRFSLHKSKLSGLWLVHNTEPHVQAFLNKEFTCLGPILTFINGFHYQ